MAMAMAKQRRVQCQRVRPSLQRQMGLPAYSNWRMQEMKVSLVVESKLLLRMTWK